MTDELAGRVAIVTGGAQGIGFATARRLASEGATVVITGRNVDKGAAAEKTLLSEGGNVSFLPHDVANGDDWARVIDTTLDRHGRLDVLVNNAGAGMYQPLLEGRHSDLQWQLATNLRGTFLALKYGAAGFRRSGNGGSIVLLSSTIGKIGGAGFSAYGGAKGGVRLMAKAAALEFGPEQIRVNTVHPAFTKTEMTKDVDPVWIETIPLARPAEPEEIASVILFLASDRSRFMTGAELFADGGMTAQ